ncbi:hypothetical protein D3C76_1571970 [compost metagenome]
MLVPILISSLVGVDVQPGHNVANVGAANSTEYPTAPRIFLAAILEWVPLIDYPFAFFVTPGIGFA